jgi:hypothetical protein
MGHCLFSVGGIPARRLRKIPQKNYRICGGIFLRKQAVREEDENAPPIANNKQQAEHAIFAGLLSLLYEVAGKNSMRRPERYAKYGSMFCEERPSRPSIKK